ncbi:MAG TPA: exodeoxyribonuclease VII small subunit [Thermohalobaculum sp.]|nr:exodeoxyribonuclease VII small subunit [Thermohalobaculum sp.]
MTDKDISKMSFEEALKALEEVVGQLEGGQVPLEQSIALYERGDALKKHCEARLGEAELKVQKIVAADGKASGTEPFQE